MKHWIDATARGSSWGACVLLVLANVGCGPAVATPGDASTSGEPASAETTTSGVPVPPMTSGMAATTDATASPPQPPPPPETTSGPWDPTAPDPTDDPCSCGFICHGFCPPKGCRGYDPDCGPSIECDVWSQDCGRGEKCAPWAKNDSPTWDATRCFPTDPEPDQVGQPCSAQGNGMSGLDTCGVAELCFYVDSDGNGTCVSFCDGNPSNPTCPEGFTCSITNEGVLALCLPACDPLMSDCASGEGCFPNAADFVCLPAPTELIVTPSTCYQSGGCEPGTICLTPEIVPGCEEETGCCSPWCDLTAPDCPADTDCVMWFEKDNVPPQFEDVGICASLP